MTVTFVNIPENYVSLHGGLWFVIPEELQEHVIPWMKSKMSEVPSIQNRRYYRRQMTKASLKSGEGADIWWKSHLGNSLSAIYHRGGEWRIGYRGAAVSLLDRIKDDFLQELRKFADQRPEWILLKDISPAT